MPLGQLFVDQFEFADALNQLALSDIEMGLITAAMLFNPGRPTLQSVSV